MQIRDDAVSTGGSQGKWLAGSFRRMVRKLLHIWLDQLRWGLPGVLYFWAVKSLLQLRRQLDHFDPGIPHNILWRGGMFKHLPEAKVCLFTY